MQPQNEIRTAVSSLRSAFLGVGAMSVVINLLMLTGPIFMLQIYDRILASGSVPTLVAIGSLALCLYAFFALLDALRARVLIRVSQQFDTDLSATAFELTNRLPLVLGERARSINLVQDLDAVRQFLSGAGPVALFDMPWMPIYLSIVFLFHPTLGWLAFSGALIVCVLVWLNERVSREPTSVATHEAAQRAAVTSTGRRNAEVIEAMGMADALCARWKQRNATTLDRHGSAADLNSAFGSAIKGLRFALQSAVLGVGAWLAILQEITPGIIIAASILTSRALHPVEQAVAHWRGFIAARQSYRRLEEFLNTRKPETEETELPLPSRTLSLDGVACGPPGAKQPFVQNVGFSLSSGEGLGIIGPSGSGKSTLARAIVGAIPTLRGTVRLDGAEYRQWSRARKGRFVGYLPQDIQLFDGTIAENIARFSPDASSDAVIDAATLADVHQLIVSLPDGYETRVNTLGGISLSAGQCQRIALARALYGRPFLVVLDEPNSNLDAEGEAALTRAIETMREHGSIVIVIAHRPSAISAVDKVLYLKDGAMGAFGPKDDVLKSVLAR